MMSDTTVNEIIPKSAADYKAIFKHLMGEVTVIEAKMKSHRTVIECLKIETRMLKLESDLIKARTQERIDILMAAS